MLMPKRVKRRKQFRGSMKGKALRGNKITNGEYGLVAMEPCWIRSNQIEAARIAMTRYIKRGGKVWIKIFPDKPVTTKPAETRMGSGKGTAVSAARYSCSSLYASGDNFSISTSHSGTRSIPSMTSSLRPITATMILKLPSRAAALWGRTMR